MCHFFMNYSIGSGLHSCVGLRYIIFGLIFIHSCYCIAQEYSFNNFTTEDGLPSNMVYEAYQDSKGFMWFSTDAGVSRFDGYEFINFTTQDGLAGNEIFHTYEDSRGRIWFLSYNGKLSYYFDGNIYNPKNTPFLKEASVDSYLNCIVEDHQGNIWIGTQDHGLILIDVSDQVFKIDIPIRKIYPFVNNNHIDYIFEGDQDTIVFAGVQGIYKISVGDRKPILVENSKGIQQEILVHRNRGIIRGSKIENLGVLFNTHSTLYLLDSTHYHIKDEIQNADINDEIIFISSDDDSLIWIGTRGGAFSIHRDMLLNERIRARKYLEQESVSSVAKDFEGNQWFSTLGNGVFMLPSLHTIDYSNQLTDTHVNSIDIDEKGNLWLGQDKGNYTRIDSNDNFFLYNLKQHNKAASRQIRYVFHNAYHIRWIPHAAEVFIFKGESVINFKASIKNLLEDTNGNLWLVTVHGLKRLKSSRINSMLRDCISCEEEILEYYFHADYFIRNRVTSLFHDPDKDRLWVGLNDGLSILKNANDSIIQPYKQHSFNSRVTGIAKGKDHSVWVATYGEGILQMDSNGEIIREITSKDGLVSDMCNAVVVGSDSSVWIATNSGLNRISISEANQVEIYLINGFDGLPSDQVNDIMIRNNALWVATRKGLVKINMEAFSGSSNILPAPRVEMFVGKEKVRIDGLEHIYAYDQNNIKINFATISYTAERNILYRYKLNRNAKTWNYTNNRSVEFSSLSPGSYEFVVQARNEQELWSDLSQAIPFRISPPWWGTWWAYMAYFLTITSIFAGIFMYENRRRQLKSDLLLEKVESNKAKELEQMKSDFFSNVSHEFRTPLTLISGPLETIIDTTNESETKKNAQIIKRSATGLHHLINQLLDISKLEAGKMELVLSEKDIVADLKLYAERFVPLADKKGITFNLPPEGQVLKIRYDSAKLEVILNNLLSNAFKFTPDGGEVNLDLCVESSWAKISVKDNGVGIPKKMQTRIFERFYQGNTSLTKAYKGTGIGLALARELIELHGGSISVESQEGKGTAFTFLLPPEIKGANECHSLIDARSSGHVDDVCVNPEEEVLSGVDQKKPTVLVVEDNPDLCEYIKDILQLDYKILIATNGQKGIEMAARWVPDLVISDVMMPVKDGIELCACLKQQEHTSHIPIILLTAKSSIHSRIEGLEIGADDYLTKPFNHLELRARIRNLIAQRKKLWERFNQNTTGILPENLNINAMDQRFLERAVAIVEANMTNEFDTSVFTREMGMSRTALHNKLKAITGKGATDFVHTVKLKKARSLLLQKVGNISEVSYQVGYKDVAYFSKKFKQLFGEPPSNIT